MGDKEVQYWGNNWGERMLYIISDDLTGATDAGVQLAKQGYETLVYIDEYNDYSSIKNDINNEEQSILVLDSESRELNYKEAVNKIRKLLKIIPLTADDVVYKKVDSTLRGNITGEISEVMEQLSYNTCFFAPSFPQNNRLVIGGYLIVDNKPLGISEYYQGKLNLGEASYIPSFLKKDGNLSVSRIDLKEVMKGPGNIIKQVKKLSQDKKQIFVFDALTSEHLKNIILSSLELEESILLSGSAGLSLHLSKLITVPAKKKSSIFKKIEIENRNKPFIIVAGSKKRIMREQIKYLQRKISLQELKISIDKLTKHKDKYLNIYSQQAGNILKENDHIIISSCNIDDFENLSDRKLEILIRNLMGELAAKIVAEFNLCNLIVTGGDTALGVCKSFGVNKLRIIEEILPGVPLTKPENKDYSYLNLITKAGGFGKENSLYKIINEYQNAEVSGLIPK